MLLAEDTVVAGRFRLNRLLGQGGMGSVWRATHLGLDIPCAVKFIEGTMAKDADIRARFEREAKAAAQLRSPHVVQILDHGICDDTPYIAMELLDGEDLGKRLGRDGPMKPAELHVFVAQVCRALTKAHALGIVHRDIKPENIFLVRDDDREIAKVLDFGIAKTTRSELGGGQSKPGSGTMPGMLLGSPYYMSPEQAQGTKTVDFRSDLWSLAVICFEALTGRLPFVSDALGDLLIKIMISEPPMPSACGCDLPGLDEWWTRAVSKDPANRFQSARALTEAFGLLCGVAPASRPSRGSAPSLPGVDEGTDPRTSAPDVAPRPLKNQRTFPGTTPSPTEHTVVTRPRARRAPLIAAALVGGAVLAGGVFFAARAMKTTPADPTTASAAADHSPQAGTVAAAAAPPASAAAGHDVPPAPAAPPSTGAASAAVPVPATAAAPSASVASPTAAPVAPAPPPSPAVRPAPPRPQSSRPATPAGGKKPPKDLGF